MRQSRSQPTSLKWTNRACSKSTKIFGTNPNHWSDGDAESKHLWHSQSDTLVLLRIIAVPFRGARLMAMNATTSRTNQKSPLGSATNIIKRSPTSTALRRGSTDTGYPIGIVGFSGTSGERASARRDGRIPRELGTWVGLPNLRKSFL